MSNHREGPGEMSGAPAIRAVIVSNGSRSDPWTILGGDEYSLHHCQVLEATGQKSPR